MSKPVESIIIPESEAEVYSEDEGRFVLNCPSNFYIINALGERVFFKTRNRQLAQDACDEMYGKGRYVIRTVKDTKSKSKLESGGLSCSGSNSRRGMGSWLKKS